MIKGPWLWAIANNFSQEYRNFKSFIHKYVQLSPEQAKKESQKQLYKYLVYCRTYSPYWRDRWPKTAQCFRPEEAEDVLALLPPLNKADLRQYRHQLRIDPQSRRPNDEYPAIRKQHTLASGGSTGVPVEISVDTTYSDRNRATYDFLYQLCGLPPGNPFFFIWGSPNELTDIKQSRKKQISTWLRGMYPLPAFGLSPEKIHRMRDQMADLAHINSAICFASAAETIVKFAEHEELNLRKLERVFTGGGLLHDQLRELLHKHLATEVFNTYASRDFGMLAHETPAHDGLSVAAWFNKLEVLKKDGVHVAPEEKGEVHVTAINNYSCALIRVAMGDTARWYPDPGQNPIPTPRLTELTGRTVEHLVGPNGVVIDPSAIIHLVGVVIAPSWLRKFQLVQRSPLQYELRVEAWKQPIPEFQLNALQTRLCRELDNLLKAQVNVNVVMMDTIPPLPSGKHQYCLREFDTDLQGNPIV